MNINLHIERLILEGLPLSGSDGTLVQAAIEAELTGLLAEHGMNQSSGGATPRLSASSIQVARGSKPAQVGQQIARAVHSTLTPTPGSTREARSAAAPHQ